MGYFIKKIIVIIFLALTLFFGGLFIYKAYQNYTYFQIAKNSDQYISTIEMLNLLMRKIEQERLLSALYLGYDGKMDFNGLKSIREDSDEILSKIDSLSLKNSLFSLDIKKIKSDLQYVRSRVDVINSEYEDIFFKYYQNEILQKCLENIKKLSVSLSSALPSLKKYLRVNEQLINYRDILNMEQSFILVLLSQAKKVSMPDMVLWESILQKQRFANVTIPSNSDMSSMLHRQLQPEILKAHMQRLRVQVLKGAASGNFSISANEWSQKMHENIKRIETANEIVENYLKRKNHQDLSSLEMIINLMIAVGLFIVGGFIVPLLKEKKRPKMNPDIEIKHLKMKNDTSSQEKKNRKIEDLLWDDLPLTNMNKRNALSYELEEKEPENFEDKEDYELTLENRVFHPIEEFKSIIKYFVNRTSKKHIDFNYYIDPAISHNCIGDIDKIREIITLFLEHSFENTSSKGEVILKIESIAQKESVTIVSFVIENSGKHINDKLRRELLQEASGYSNKLTDSYKNNTNRLDLHRGAKLISFLGGNLQIERSDLKGTLFSISLNLKKSKA